MTLCSRESQTLTRAPQIVIKLFDPTDVLKSTTPAPQQKARRSAGCQRISQRSRRALFVVMNSVEFGYGTVSSIGSVTLFPRTAVSRGGTRQLSAAWVQCTSRRPYQDLQQAM